MPAIRAGGFSVVFTQAPRGFADSFRSFAALSARSDCLSRRATQAILKVYGDLKITWNHTALFMPWVILYDRRIFVMAVTRKLRFLAQENVSTTLVPTDVRVILDTVDGTAPLILTSASHHLAKMVSK